MHTYMQRCIFWLRREHENILGRRNIRVERKLACSIMRVVQVYNVFEIIEDDVKELLRSQLIQILKPDCWV